MVRSAKYRLYPEEEKISPDMGHSKLLKVSDMLTALSSGNTQVSGMSSRSKEMNQQLWIREKDKRVQRLQFLSNLSEKHKRSDV